MTFDRTWAQMETLGYVIDSQTRCVEPFLKGVRLAVVAEGVAIPHASERRHFVETRPTARLSRQWWIAVHRDTHDRVDRPKVFGHPEPGRGREFVVRRAGAYGSSHSPVLEDCWPLRALSSKRLGLGGAGEYNASPARQLLVTVAGAIHAPIAANDVPGWKSPKRDEIHAVVRTT